MNSTFLNPDKTIYMQFAALPLISTLRIQVCGPEKIAILSSVMIKDPVGDVDFKILIIPVSIY
jgi:hypothetical protein